jgi:ribonuclease P/MRP protein subunit RPP40
MNYLNSNKFLSPCQHGFVDQKTCTTNLLETMDMLTSSMADKKQIDLIFLDFAKAFDKVPHQRLLLKLLKYGINGIMLAWIKAFLSNRRQRVIMGNSVSNWVKVSSSVPQDSGLGPILFVIFINDLLDCVSSACICKMYEDDTKLLAIINSDDDHAQLQGDLNSINVWTHKWLMELNFKKCKFMHTGYKPVQSGQSTRVFLETTKTERDLGFQLSADLKCHDQAQVSAANEIFMASRGKLINSHYEYNA